MKKNIIWSLTTLVLMSSAVYPQTDQTEPGEEIVTFIMGEGVAAPERLPDRGDEGQGPFKRLVIKDVYVIDGTGAPAYGPASIAIENDRIMAISAGEHAELYKAGSATDENTRIIEGKGYYVLPGFIDSHAHFGSTISANFGGFNDPEYVAKLMLGHGITTIRDVATLWGLGYMLDLKKRSAAGQVTAPRIIAYPQFPGEMTLNSLSEARAWVKAVHKRGADGIKFALNEFIASKGMYEAAVGEAKKLGMGVATHYGVQHINVLDSARLGVNSSEHGVNSGIPEALRLDNSVKNYPLDYIKGDYERRLKGRGLYAWADVAKPGSEKWQKVIAELVELKHTLVPTLSILEARRDLMRASRAVWHDEYTLPALAKAFQPNPNVHGSGFLDWTTTDEVAWKKNYITFMQFLNDFRKEGGNVAAGADAGFIYQIYGFGFIRELELLQEAGFHPLEVVQAATLNGAKVMGMEEDIGTIQTGKKADFIILEENPLPNFKLLYGTGHMKYNVATKAIERVGSVKYTIKDGIIWDARKLLADVRNMVAAEKTAQTVIENL